MKEVATCEKTDEYIEKIMGKWYNKMMKSSQTEANLYISDQHFGEVNPKRDVMGKKLRDFINEYNFKINEVIDIGDGMNCGLLEESLGKTEKEIAEINSGEARGIKDFYQNILPDGGKISVVLGNHQTEVVEGDITADSTKNATQNSIKNIQTYIGEEIQPELPELKFDVISGIQKVEEDVVVEHGTYYDVFSTVRNILDEFDSDMTLEEKLEKLNANP